MWYLSLPLPTADMALGTFLHLTWGWGPWDQSGGTTHFKGFGLELGPVLVQTPFMAELTPILKNGKKARGGEVGDPSATRAGSQPPKVILGPGHLLFFILNVVPALAGVAQWI